MSNKITWRLLVVKASLFTVYVLHTDYIFWSYSVYDNHVLSKFGFSNNKTNLSQKKDSLQSSKTAVTWHAARNRHRPVHVFIENEAAK